ncbi:MAG: LapA family protein [Planctomycetota bacterium]|jgi:uncharacterized integral membrane protein
MSQDENRTDAAVETPEESPPTEASEAKRASGRSCAWAKLILVALVAAVLGAVVTANWTNMPFCWVFGHVNANAGLVILGAAVLGFVLGVLFLWSALERGE